MVVDCLSLRTVNEGPFSGCKKLAASTLAAPDTNRSAALRSLKDVW